MVNNISDLPKIECQAGKINQVFVNILDNAIEASELGGRIEINSNAQDNIVCIEIKDNGQGMNESELRHIFDPFFTTKDVGQGTGLRMSISYSIIRDHGGNIQVKSSVGQGTMVSLYLPVNQ